MGFFLSIPSRHVSRSCRIVVQKKLDWQTKKVLVSWSLQRPIDVFTSKRRQMKNSAKRRISTWLWRLLDVSDVFANLLCDVCFICKSKALWTTIGRLTLDMPAGSFIDTQSTLMIKNVCVVKSYCKCWIHEISTEWCQKWISIYQEHLFQKNMVVNMDTQK